MERIIPFLSPRIPDSHVLMESVKEIIDSGIFVFGEYTDLFEKKIASLCHVKHAIALSNCSDGLILAMSHANPLVIMPAFTFSATWQAVYWNRNLKYTFVDVDTTGRISLEALEFILCRHPNSTILAVHMYGNPCDTEKLQSLADRYESSLFFDSAHGLGAAIKGKQIGSGGRAEVFSIGITKCLPCGEGGVITTNDDELADSLVRARIHGKVNVMNHYESPLDVDIPGLNARPQEFNAALGCHLLNYLPKFILRRNEIASFYREEFGQKVITKIEEGNTCSYKDFAVRVGNAREDKLKVMQSLLEQSGIQTKEYYYPIMPKLQTVLKDSSHYLTYSDTFPVASLLAETAMAIPIYPAMTDSDVEYVAKKVKECL